METRVVAETKRDEYMRLVGELKAAVQLVEMINVPREDKRVAELKDSGQRLLNKAMLAAWEHAHSASENSGV